MIEMPGEVVAVDAGRALVRTRAQSGCGRCNEPGGCGGVQVGSMFRGEHADFWLDNRIDARVGDPVLVCLPEQVTLGAALLGYLVPVVGIVIGAAVGVAVGGAGATDGHALGGALGGLAVGVVVSRALGRSAVSTPEPELRRGGAPRC